MLTGIQKVTIALRDPSPTDWQDPPPDEQAVMEVYRVPWFRRIFDHAKRTGSARLTDHLTRAVLAMTRLPGQGDAGLIGLGMLAPNLKALLSMFELSLFDIVKVGGDGWRVPIKIRKKFLKRRLNGGLWRKRK